MRTNGDTLFAPRISSLESFELCFAVQFLDTEDRDDVAAEGDTFLDGAPASLRCEDTVASPNGVRDDRFRRFGAPRRRFLAASGSRSAA